MTGYNLSTADMDPTVKQLIAKAVTSAVAAAVHTIETRYKEEILALQEMIEKYLLFRDFSFSTLFSDLDAALKAHLTTDSLPKASTKR